MNNLQTYLETLGKRVHTVRKSKKLSQQTLADTAGLDRAYISSIENGKQNITIGVIFRLADALELPINDLLLVELMGLA